MRTGHWGLLALCLTSGSVGALAGPPFQTDDPEPVDYQHYEAYFFALADSTKLGTGTQGPAVEVNWGAAPNLQLHLVVPWAGNLPPGGPDTFGLGDIEIGAKYRFVQEKGARPQVGVFPFLEIPSGDASRGLGNGQVWARLPVWVQKSWGPWTSYGGGGAVVNGAPGLRNYPFAGWLVQRDLSKKLTLGAEVFAHGGQGPASPSPRSSTLVDAGGYYNFNPGFSLLFAAGHSVAGQGETYAYLSLYWTWGKKAPAKQLNAGRWDPRSAAARGPLFLEGRAAR
jgi:hypothetical protein